VPTTPEWTITDLVEHVTQGRHQPVRLILEARGITIATMLTEIA
jgi:hypothetical protein